MDGQLNFLLEHGSYGILLAYLLAAGLGMPMPEDIALLAAGVLIDRGVTRLEYTVAVCFVGVLAGDMIIFMTARRWGPSAYQHPFIARLLRPSRRDKLERLFARYGGGVVFLARHVAGIRAPVFALAGIHQMKITTFLFWDAIALCISGPFFIGLGYFFSDRLDAALRGLEEARWYVFATVGVVIVLGLAYLVLKRTLLRNGDGD